MAPNVSGSPSPLFGVTPLAGAEVIPSKTEQQQHIQLTKLKQQQQQQQQQQRPKYQLQIVWRNVAAFLFLHIGCLYGLYLLFTTAKLSTVLWTLLISSAGATGITAGAHRLWAHKAYRARWPLRLLLAVFQTLAFQNHIYEWVRDHRVHHKFTDTDADPHNSRRGFFFSHIGWLMVRKHSDVITKGRQVDMSDLERDWVVMLQKRYYLIAVPFFCFFIPTWVPVHFWGEKAWVAWYVAGICRYTLSLNFTWLVNSAAHIWGTKPYDKNITPTENVTVAMLAFGEGWHNYHHAFPYDYKAAELGNYRANLTTAFIDMFARIGWAYDLKMATPAMVQRRILRTGDGSHDSVAAHDHHHHQDEVWGWDDKDMTTEDKKLIEIINRVED
ncbi:acyl-CoA Delta(11) desaturase isoform X2 [Nilaparvata lugens]|nr:acyl-CoA Delta(11) desaturase isoform X2 [Nilaparvata lugens]XP_039286051.1 acyl-CoA Delta(11) desaturase isoform X2 [Nilaparvata lugens]